MEGKVEYLEQLQQWLHDEIDWRLCYRASRDGWRSRDFHSRCDFKGPTVTLIKAGYYIFGGYSDIPWGGSKTICMEYRGRGGGVKHGCVYMGIR